MIRIGGTHATWLVVVFLLALVVWSAHAECTAQTCVGPVAYRFSTPNCTGTPSHIEEMSYDSSVPTGTCRDAGNSLSDKVTCGNGILTRTQYYDSACQESLYGYAQATGVCIYYPSDGSSQVLTCNVNDTSGWTGPGTVDDTKPIYSYPFNTQGSCNTQAECAPTSATTGIIYSLAYFNAAGCPDANLTGVISNNGTANYTFGECFYEPPSATDILVTCTETDIVTTRWQNGAGCSGTPISVDTTPQNRCYPDTLKRRRAAGGFEGISQNQDFSRYFVERCYIASPPPSASTPPTPTSNANGIRLAGVLVGAVFAIALLSSF